MSPLTEVPGVLPEPVPYLFPPFFASQGLQDLGQTLPDPSCFAEDCDCTTFTAPGVVCWVNSPPQNRGSLRTSTVCQTVPTTPHDSLHILGAQ
jgi:hypothetical protein